MYMCVYVCTSVRLYVCTSVRLYVCTSVCLYVCMYVCMVPCPVFPRAWAWGTIPLGGGLQGSGVWTHIYMYIYIYIYLYIYCTHTYLYIYLHIYHIYICIHLLTFRNWNCTLKNPFEIQDGNFRTLDWMHGTLSGFVLPGSIWIRALARRVFSMIFVYVRVMLCIVFWKVLIMLHHVPQWKRCQQEPPNGYKTVRF